MYGIFPEQNPKTKGYCQSSSSVFCVCTHDMHFTVPQAKLIEPLLHAHLLEASYYHIIHEQKQTCSNGFF